MRTVLAGIALLMLSGCPSRTAVFFSPCGSSPAKTSSYINKVYKDLAKYCPTKKFQVNYHYHGKCIKDNGRLGDVFKVFVKCED